MISCRGRYSLVAIIWHVLVVRGEVAVGPERGAVVRARAQVVAAGAAQGACAARLRGLDGHAVAHRQARHVRTDLRRSPWAHQHYRTEMEISGIWRALEFSNDDDDRRSATEP